MDGIIFIALMVASAMGGAAMAFMHCTSTVNRLRRAAVITGETMLQALADIREMSVRYPQLIDQLMPIMIRIAEGFERATDEASNTKE